MPQSVIEAPVRNSPFTEPVRHFDFTDERSISTSNAQVILAISMSQSAPPSLCYDAIEIPPLTRPEN